MRQIHHFFMLMTEKILLSLKKKVNGKKPILN